MKKTWRWGSVQGRAVDVMRTASSLAAAATVLGVDRQTVHRWIKAGKIPPPGGGRRPAVPVPLPAVPVDWAASVRADYALSPTEQELVGLGETALALARDASLKPADRLAAAARFQSLTKQLHLEEADEHGQTEGQRTRWPAAG